MKSPRKRRSINERASSASSEPADIDETAGNNDNEDESKRGRARKASAKKLQLKSARQLLFSPQKLVAGLTSASKRRKAELQMMQRDQKLADSYILKLFDRTLDLSKYTNDTPLYPVCRAWIANQPRNPNIPNYRERQSPVPPKRENNAAEILQRLRHNEQPVVTVMPAPLPAKIAPFLPCIKRNFNLDEMDQELQLNTKQDEEDDKQAETESQEKQMNDDKQLPDRSQLLSSNVQRWKKVKRDWQQHNKLYNKRYAHNFDILDALFKPDEMEQKLFS